jgi:hypothetical protein
MSKLLSDISSKTNISLSNKDDKSDSDDLSDSESDSDIGEADKIEIDPLKVLDTKEIYFYKMIDKFYKSCDKSKIEQMINIIEGTSPISLRVLDWVVTRYSKKYIDYDIKHKLTGEVFDIHISYKSQLKSFKKRYFDPFRRRKKFYYTYTAENFTKTFFTTLGQLNFFKWAISNDIIQFVEKNLEEILVSMNVSNKEDKKKKEKKKQTLLKQELNSNKDNASVGSSGGYNVEKKTSQKDKAKIIVKDNNKTNSININATQNIKDDEAEIILVFN